DARGDSTVGLLHREGVTQVVGYHGPISDVLSTRAEAALYQEIARGATTRYAVRQARAALLAASPVYHGSYGPGDRDAAIPLREGERVFVLQGLGGLGKSTLALHLLPMLAAPNDTCVLWCQEAEKHDDPSAALVQQLLAFCRSRFGSEWESVVQQVDRVAGDAADQRFAHFLHT